MVKGIFLIGEAKTLLNSWSGKTKKGYRTLKESGNLNGSRIFKGGIRGKRGEKFDFHFITLESRRVNKIQELIGRLGLTDSEVVLIATNKEKWLIDSLSLGDGSQRRYQESTPLLIYLKRGVDYRDANELASMLFFNR